MMVGPKTARLAEKAGKALANEHGVQGETAEAAYNFYAQALRDGQYSSLVLLAERLEDRMSIATRDAEETQKLMREAEGAIRDIKEGLSGSEEPVPTSFWRTRQAALETWNKAGRIVISGDYRSQPLAVRGELSFPPSAQEALKDLDRLRGVALELYGRATFVGGRAHDLLELLRKAIDGFELEIWPPMWIELPKPSSWYVFPRERPRPLRAEEIEFRDGRFRHRPFRWNLAQTYAYLRVVGERSHSEAFEETRAWHEEHHGPIIQSRFEGKSSIDARTLRKYLIHSQVWAPDTEEGERTILRARNTI